MQFKNNSEHKSGMSPNQQLEAAKRELVETSTRVENLRQEESSYSERTGDLAKINQEIEAAIIRKSELENSICELEKEHNEKVSTYSNYSEQKSVEIQSIANEIASKENLKAELDRKIDGLTSDISRLEESRKSKEEDLNSKVDELNLLIDEKTKDKQQLEAEAGSVKSQIEALEDEKKSLIKTIGDLEAEKSEKLKNLEDIRNQIDDAIKQLEFVNKEASDKISEMKQFDEQKKEEYSRIEERLASREGAVNDRENWLNAKTENLKSIKKELEMFHGKKITSVNIQ